MEKSPSDLRSGESPSDLRSESPRTALVAGASGLVGTHLLEQLLAHEAWGSVISLGRRKLPIEHPKLRQETVDFAALDRLTLADEVDDVFSCLGTTIKKAGSKEAFSAVDHDAVVAVGKAGLAAGAERMLHVSALGADSGSSIFYNRVKGDTEADVAKLGFRCDVALRPSIIDGERSESRPGERLGLAVTRFLAPVLGKYKPTHADAIARAMIHEALRDREGHHVLESKEILEIAALTRT
ncbi:MAG TPA: oxidoreductase [Polyangiaceae bacterium]|nr:oxidoreductase [Polyangiaceae bacterium]